MQKPNDEVYLMNFIFNEDPDRVSKNLGLSSLHFTTDSFTNKAQVDTEFSERLKLKDNIVLTILNLMSHHTSVSNMFITWGCTLFYSSCTYMYYSVPASTGNIRGRVRFRGRIMVGTLLL